MAVSKTSINYLLERLESAQNELDYAQRLISETESTKGNRAIDYCVSACMTMREVLTWVVKYGLVEE